ncbi:hypothetical protein [Lacrimispora amygdalina]|uniref:hypothetical protein n=1 Tax=Lacrimispora amygdalina TaxID=253257 RepID=UPI000BE226CC|nr:hypothetical protein [Lacrimispora amygdalina]
MKSKICANIKETSINDMKIVIPYNGWYESVSDSNVLVTYSEFTTEKNKGRVIALFERKNESLLNQIIGSSPAYDISYIRYFVDEYPDNNILYYTNIDIKDIDSDGNNDIFLSLQTNFATRITHSEILLTKKDGRWKMVLPQPDLFEAEVEELNKKGYSLSYDTFVFKNPIDDKEDITFGLSHDGGVYITNSPLSGGVDLCYEISANDGTADSSLNSHYVYIMFQLKNGELVKDDNWNGGKPLILKCGDDFMNNKDQYWGYTQETNLWFYSSPNAEENQDNKK